MEGPSRPQRAGSHGERAGGPSGDAAQTARTGQGPEPGLDQVEADGGGAKTAATRRRAAVSRPRGQGVEETGVDTEGKVSGSVVPAASADYGPAQPSAAAGQRPATVAPREDPNDGDDDSTGATAPPPDPDTLRAIVEAVRQWTLSG